MTTLTEQTSLLESAVEALRAENETLRSKNQMQEFEIGRLAAEVATLTAKNEYLLRRSEAIKTVLDCGASTIVEGLRRINGAEPTTPVPVVAYAEGVAGAS